VSNAIRSAAPYKVLAGAGLVAALVALLMAALSGATPKATAAGGEFKVLFIVPLSGPFATSGKEELAGLNAGIKTVNASKGILGKRVTVKVIDDAQSGAKATASALQELGSTKYDLVTCGISGPDAVPCHTALAKTKVLQINPAAEDDLADPTKNPNTFISLNRFASNAAAVVGQLKKDKKSKVVVFGGDNASGRNGASAFVAAAKKAHITVTDSIFIPTGTTDATPQLQKAQASGAQAMVVMAFTVQNIAVMKARAKIGWNAPAYLDPFASAFNYASVLSDTERGGVSTSAYPITVKGDKVSKTRAAKLFYRNVAVYNPKPVLSLIAGMVTYNAIMIARAAAVTAKSTDAGKMIKAAAKLKTVKQVPGLVGYKRLYTKAKTDHSPQTAGSEFKWYRNAPPIVDGLVNP
jgi:ABC-type branched-subunit amino acid transport system substrate-binding protein